MTNNIFSSPELLLLGVILMPGLVFLTLGLAWLLGIHVRERAINILTTATYAAAVPACGFLFRTMWSNDLDVVSITLGHWFSIGEYVFPLTLRVDLVSLPMLVLTVVLVGLTGAFSFRYLHRERGFFRFFLLLHLFAFGAMLSFSAGSLDLMVGGWEIVGITSVLLIAFFDDRPEPVGSALRVFGIYRATDVGLLVGVVILHHFAGSASFDAFTKAAANGGAGLAGLMLLLAACGKSAQIPFSGWLPRAMEGPTPSSAIFYGAISVHLGAYLMLRAAPLLDASWIATAAIVTVGLLTAVHGTLVGRTCADAKTSLAYAALVQLGIIFVEIGLGFRWLALTHMVGHALLRTLQFLRAPSLLHEYHQMHAAAGGDLSRAGIYYEALLPESVRMWLYRWALLRGYLDAMLDRYFVAPLNEMARWIAAVEHSLAGIDATPRRGERPSVPLARISEERADV
ncbi:MAG: hypothetical protein IT168_16360 [Bryobacterales bacterium]|nr:hypothetical protein [Bryobacterales bacterium]